jgi:hypothetical protein
MKTVLDTATRDEVIRRIATLNENSQAQWGKMNIHQMLKHCALAEEMYLGKTIFKQGFIGKLFGSMALKNLLKDDRPLGHSTPTIPELKNLDREGDIAIEKDRWIALVQEYAHFSNPITVHPFFGPMTADQIGIMAYKHIDHHLRQFKS